MPVPSNIPAHAKEIFERIMESLKGKTNPRTGKPYTDEERGRIAWSAIKRKYKKVGEKWQSKQDEDFEEPSDDEEDLVFSELLEFKAEDGKYFFKGYLSTFDIDLVNDLVTPDCMKDMLNQINAGVGGFARSLKGSPDHDVFHTRDQQRLPISKITTGKLDNRGLFIEGIFNPDHPEFKTIWNQIQNGFLDGLSIEYKPVDFSFKDINGKKVRVLNKILLKGYGHTPRPANPYSTLTDFFVKSLIEEELKDETSMVKEHLQRDSQTWKELASKAEEESKADLELIQSLGGGEMKEKEKELVEDEDEDEEAVKARITAQEGEREKRKMSEEEYYAFPRLKKLPIFDAAHTRNAMARFNQTQGMSTEEKATAKRKIIRAAKKFGIEVGEFAKVGPETKGEDNLTEEVKKEEAEPQPVPQTEVKQEPKVEEVEAKPEVKSFDVEQIKALIKEELKNLIPEKKSLPDSSEKFEEAKAQPKDLIDYVVKSLGV